MEVKTAGITTAPRFELEPADRLRLDVRVVGRTLTFAYDVDGRFAGEVTAAYPFDLDGADIDTLPALGVGVATFIGQLCLAREIELGFAADARAVADATPLAEMLYDVRCWKDERDLRPPPTFKHRPGSLGLIEGPGLDERRACLLWSGGKDSTLSVLVLRRNLIDVRPIHVTANAGVEGEEAAAIGRLSAALGQPYRTLAFGFPQYLELSSAYARTWNSFPYYNTVAFGRDLLLALLITPFLRHERAAVLSMGHEHDCKTAYFTYQGKSVPRNDVESIRGSLALERFIQRNLVPGARLVPPLAGLSEFRVLNEMLLAHADLFRLASFCFWGGNCGRCSKCLRYDLAQRVLGLDVLSFAVSPLAGSSCPELRDYVDHWDDEAALFRKQVLYCLGRIVQRGDIRAGEAELERFATTVFPRIAGELDGWERELMATYSDPQLPPGFVAP